MQQLMTECKVLSVVQNTTWTILSWRAASLLAHWLKYLIDSCQFLKLFEFLSYYSEQENTNKRTRFFIVEIHLSLWICRMIAVVLQHQMCIIRGIFLHYNTLVGYIFFDMSSSKLYQKYVQHMSSFSTKKNCSITFCIWNICR